MSGPSGANTTQDAFVASPCVWLTSKHSMRWSGDVEPEKLPQVLELLGEARLRRLAHLQRVRRILQGERDPALRIAASRGGDADLAARHAR